MAKRNIYIFVSDVRIKKLTHEKTLEEEIQLSKKIVMMIGWRRRGEGRGEEGMGGRGGRGGGGG